MDDIEELRNEIATSDIELIDYKFTGESVGALCLVDDSDRCIIAVDEKRCISAADIKSKLYHEYGHCCTGSHYTRLMPRLYKARCEYKADKYIAQNAITKEKIENASRKNGYSELWEFAEYFNVTIEYMKRMFKIHYDMEFMD